MVGPEEDRSPSAVSHSYQSWHHITHETWMSTCCPPPPSHPRSPQCHIHQAMCWMADTGGTLGMDTGTSLGGSHTGLEGDTTSQSPIPTPSMTSRGSGSAHPVIPHPQPYPSR